MTERDAGQTDGEEPMTSTPPYGATIVVHRPTAAHRAYLILHRAHYGSEFSGEWAWGPPSGSRFPNEDFDQCAARELFEETGLRLALRQLDAESREWLVYMAEAPENAAVCLSPEHDRFTWLPLDQAIELVAPAVVRGQLERAALLLDASGLDEAR